MGSEMCIRDSYKGTVVVVSHDRDFLDRTVTRILGYEGEGRWQLYAGGYSDMIAQRGFGVQARKKAQKEQAAKDKAREAGAPTAAPKAKLSYKHKFRLEQLPAEMEGLGADIAKLEAKLSDADFFQKDPDGFNLVIKDLDKLRSKLESCEEEWLELEMLREAVS